MSEKELGARGDVHAETLKARTWGEFSDEYVAEGALVAAALGAAYLTRCRIAGLMAKVPILEELLPAAKSILPAAAEKGLFGRIAGLAAKEPLAEEFLPAAKLVLPEAAEKDLENHGADAAHFGVYESPTSGGGVIHAPEASFDPRSYRWVPSRGVNLDTITTPPDGALPAKVSSHVVEEDVLRMPPWVRSSLPQKIGHGSPTQLEKNVAGIETDGKVAPETSFDPQSYRWLPPTGANTDIGSRH